MSARKIAPSIQFCVKIFRRAGERGALTRLLDSRGDYAAITRVDAKLCVPLLSPAERRGFSQYSRRTVRW